MRLFLCLLLTLLITACASSAPEYGPASTERGKGFRSVKLEENRYRVTWRGGPTDLARDNALRRAAEITLRQGYQWFEVMNVDSEKAGRRAGPRTGISIGGSTGSRGRSGVGVGIGIGIPIQTTRSGDSFISMEILLGRGEKPDRREAYNARSVLDNLGTR